MTKNEALKAAIDGKKVRNDCWEDKRAYFDFDGKTFIFHGEGVNTFEIDMRTKPSDGWQIFPEYVDFFTAWKAYEQGKVIQSCQPFSYFRANDGNLAISPKEIRGEWIILD